MSTRDTGDTQIEKITKRIKTMRRSKLINVAIPAAVLAVLLGFKGSVAQTSRSFDEPIVYPFAKKVDHVDDYGGIKVRDPYRWLEDVNSADTRAWIQAENRVTFGYLEKIPARQQIKNRLTTLWNYEKFGIPFKEGNRYFYSHNGGLQNQNIIYTTKTLDTVPHVLLDPNKLSADGTVALSGYRISEDGKYMAYGISDAGSDWQEWKVRDVTTGKDLPDRIKWVKFSGASWTHDGKGFFYSRYNEPDKKTKLKNANYYHKLYFHKLNTSQLDDVLVYDRPDHKDWGFGGEVSEDGRYLVIVVWKGTERKNMIFYKDLDSNNGKVVELINKFEAQYVFLGNDGPTFWFRTDLDAPKGRIIAIDTNKPDRANYQEIIPESADALRRVSLVNDTFIASYLKDARTQVKMYSLAGKSMGEGEFPGIGTASGFGGKRDHKETFYSFTSYTTPRTIYRYDMVTGKSTVFRQPKVDFDPNDYETKQVFYRSKDGTRIPMFITSKKGMKRDGNNPTYLYGYGGFNIAITPSFSVSNLVWMEMGGIVAVPNIRGGGEYGQAWHEAGTKLNKQNVFDDFIAAAQWLIDNKYTSTPRLAIAGRSNGGLLIGACMTQRPNLYGACLPGVGVLDMLRFNKFTIGWAWVSDYGSPEDPQQFKALYAYSPLHNVKPGTAYPATMITTADHDDRVFPAHSFKFAAALQAAQSGSNPILIRIETRAGHGAGKPTSKRIEEATDQWAFLVKTFQMKPGKGS